MKYNNGQLAIIHEVVMPTGFSGMLPWQTFSKWSVTKTVFCTSVAMTIVIHTGLTQLPVAKHV